MKKSIVIGCVAALATVCNVAHAGYVNEEPGAQITVIGKTAGLEKSVGLGNNVTLGDALKNIVPKDYSIVTSDLIRNEMDRKISWRGGKVWTETLTESMHGIAVTAMVNTSNKTVVLTSDVSVSTPIVAPTVWVIKRGESIAAAMRGWAAVAGWNGLYWDAPELVSDLDRDAVFTGTFEEAITQAVGALPKIRAVMYDGNKVIKIMEKK